MLAIEVPAVPHRPYRFNILEVRADRTRTVLFTQEGYAGLGLVADAAGNIFVLGSSPLNARLFVLSPAGTLVATYSLGGGENEAIEHVDLAADQCTLYYRLDDGVLRRFNVCTGLTLGNVATPPAGAVALLSDGDLLIARNNELRRHDESGTLVRTYTLGAPFQSIDAVGLSAHGHRALAHFYCEREIRELDLVTGSVTVRPEALNTVRGLATAIVPKDAWTAALGAGAAIATTDIPSLRTAGLFALAGLLAFFGLRNLSQNA